MLSPYGYSKLLAEETLREHSRHEACFVLRPRLLYGPYDKIILPRMLRMVRNGVLYKAGSMESTISICHYRNFAHAVECCLRSDLKGLRMYNITDAQPVVLVDMVRKITAELYGKTLSEKQIPIPVLRLLAFLRIGDMTPLFLRNLTRNAVLDISLARMELGYQPTVQLEQALPEWLDWVQRIGGVTALLTESRELPWQ
ncbi:MAG: NAD(P)-dependent oxidoreductase [Lewinellaceae bacterium]|nr:NAD(P)-dependent oxidoreductase [Lewinellaceae bacterium]